MTFLQAYQSGNLVLPAALLFHFKDIFSEADDFLVWQFFYLQNSTRYDNMIPSSIAQALGKTLSEVNTIISRLTTQELLKMQTIELDGEIESLFDASPALAKLDYILSGEKAMTRATQPKEQKDQALADYKALVEDFSREFGRMLSPFELEDLRKTVVEDGLSADVVREALREAVFNGKLNMNYINAILRNWRQEGIRTVRQVEERRMEREQSQPKNVEVSKDFLDAMDLWS